MKLSVTIPQMFYDLIARVVPGFLFLLMLDPAHIAVLCLW